MNLLLSSLNTGIEIATFIVLIRKALILDIDHSLAEKRVSVNKVLDKIGIVYFGGAYLPVSIKLSLSDPAST